jgi:hypothetical protein
MTARISLILGKSGAHIAPLQLRPVNLFTASMTAHDVEAQHRGRSAKRKRDSAQPQKIDRPTVCVRRENKILVATAISRLRILRRLLAAAK